MTKIVARDIKEPKQSLVQLYPTYDVGPLDTENSPGEEVYPLGPYSRPMGVGYQGTGSQGYGYQGNCDVDLLEKETHIKHLSTNIVQHYAPVICIPSPYGARDSGDTVRIECRDLISDESQQVGNVPGLRFTPLYCLFNSSHLTTYTTLNQ